MVKIQAVYSKMTDADIHR